MMSSGLGWKLLRLGLVFFHLSILPNAWAAPQYQVLHAFGSEGDRGGVYAGVSLDKKGNLYGTTSGGGAYGYGSVYKLRRQPDVTWAEKVLHSFRSGDPDGQEPEGGILVAGSGTLYGMAQLGGIDHAGTVFQMTPSPAGWNLQVIYNFCSQPGCADGGSPWGNLVMDAAGNLYGTAFNVFQLTPGPDGWTENPLYTFSCVVDPCPDGKQPFAGVILDSKGNLYGTTEGGGNYSPACPVSNGCGVVFRVKPVAGGGWKYAVLHRFAAFPEDGQKPLVGQLALDDAGSLYGTTNQGGKNVCFATHCGTIFRLTRQPNGHWKEAILHHFRRAKGGYWPGAGVVMDGAGNLYGTTTGGGTDCDCGVLYKLAPNPDGSWSYTVLHRLTGYDGAVPGANMILDDQGNLYGTTVTGGPEGEGVVFKLTP